MLKLIQATIGLIIIMGMLEDLVDTANRKLGNYRREFILSPDKMNLSNYAINSLKWDYINFKTGDKKNIPNNKRGIYAFVIRVDNNVLPPHGYIMYIGIAGKNSNRSLRERYGDYLNERKVAKRSNLTYMIGTWSKVLQFFFAPIEDEVSSKDLQELEKQLNGAFIPPISKGDFYADVKPLIAAFR